MTTSKVFAVAVLLLFAMGTSVLATAQEDMSPVQPTAQQKPAPAPSAIFKHPGQVIRPESSVARPEDAGIRAHTNYLLFLPEGRKMSEINPENTYAEYPASLACVYGVGPQYAGCVPTNNSAYNATGGWGAIALVDAYDNPNAASDINYFSSFFGLPAPKFTKVYANTSFGTLNGLTASCSGTPAGNTGWGLEEDLDIEWAHAMAPSAKIILVEACSNSYNDLLFAEQVAGIKVKAAGGGDISNSWQGSESSSQLGPSGWDNYFYRYYYDKITYFASSGDSGYGVGFPSTNPWVVSAGGTTVNRDANGNFVSESCWSGSGGGYSAIETWLDPDSASGGKNNAIYYGMGPWVDYQYQLFGGYPYTNAPRSTPDISFDADPNSGAWVYDTYGGGTWYVVGGTSLSSPALAAIVNGSNNRLGQTPLGGGKYFAHENDLLYSQLSTNKAYVKNFYDVTTGSNGHSAGVGYDQCTGIGSVRGKLGK